MMYRSECYCQSTASPNLHRNVHHEAVESPENRIQGVGVEAQSILLTLDFV